MTRKRKINLSDAEKELLKTTRNTVYGPNTPYGIVVEKACRKLLSEEDY